MIGMKTKGSLFEAFEARTKLLVCFSLGERYFQWEKTNENGFKWRKTNKSPAVRGQGDQTTTRMSQDELTRSSSTAQGPQEESRPSSTQRPQVQQRKSYTPQNYEKKRDYPPIPQVRSLYPGERRPSSSNNQRTFYEQRSRRIGYTRVPTKVKPDRGHGGVVFEGDDGGDLDLEAMRKNNNRRRGGSGYGSRRIAQTTTRSSFVEGQGREYLEMVEGRGRQDTMRITTTPKPRPTSEATIEPSTASAEPTEYGNYIEHIGHRGEDRRCDEGWVKDIYGHCRLGYLSMLNLKVDLSKFKLFLSGKFFMKK